MSSSDGKGYLLPSIVDPPKICIQISIPNERQHIAAFMGQLYSLGLWFNWERDIAHTGKDVSAVWFDIYTAFSARYNSGELFEGDCMSFCDEVATCPPMIRTSVDGLEWFNPATGQWEHLPNSNGDPRTDGTVQAPWITPPSGQTGNCLSAANVTKIFSDMMVDFGDKLGVISEVATFLVGVEAWLALALGPIGEVITIATAMADGAISAGATLVNLAFDPATQTAAYDGIKCLLECAAASDGSFDQSRVDTVKLQFSSQIDTWVTDPSQNALWRLFFPDFLDSQGKNGLTLMGRMAGINSADCSACTSCDWIHIFDFTVDDGGFTPITVLGQTWGVWVPLRGWKWTDINAGGSNDYRIAVIDRTFASTEIHSMQMTYDLTNGTRPVSSGNLQAYVLANSHIYGTVYEPAAVDGNNQQLGSVSTQTARTLLEMQLYSSYTNTGLYSGDLTITKLVVTGSGTDPF